MLKTPGASKDPVQQSLIGALTAVIRTRRPKSCGERPGHESHQPGTITACWRNLEELRKRQAAGRPPWGIGRCSSILCRAISAKTHRAWTDCACDPSQPQACTFTRRPWHTHSKAAKSAEDACAKSPTDRSTACLSCHGAPRTLLPVLAGGGRRRLTAALGSSHEVVLSHGSGRHPLRLLLR